MPIKIPHPTQKLFAHASTTSLITSIILGNEFYPSVTCGKESCAFSWKHPPFLSSSPKCRPPNKSQQPGKKTIAQTHLPAEDVPGAFHLGRHGDPVVRRERANRNRDGRWSRTTVRIFRSNDEEVGRIRTEPGDGGSVASQLSERDLPSSGVVLLWVG